MIADLQQFLMDLRLWLEQIELGIRSSPSADRRDLEKRVATELSDPILDTLTHHFEAFEVIAEKLEPELVPAHRTYAKRQLHPHLLVSPFLYRTFQKPLGYAGDYEMVNMITRDPLEGSSLFSKLINLWFLKQPPAEAHRNRIQYLTQKLTEEALRTRRAGRPLRVLSLGCGPAREVQNCIAASELANGMDFTLMDFNEETLAHTATVLNEMKSRYHRMTDCHFLRRSVSQLLKHESRTFEGSQQSRYDLVYCAGLFDYLSDQVCRRLMNILYAWTAPGGLLIATNVHSSNPRRLTMEFVMEWNLIYRDRSAMEALQPERLGSEVPVITSDLTGVNTYLEVRKPEDE